MEEGNQGSEIERLKAELAALQQKLEERERSEAALRTENEALRTLFRQLPVAVWATDHEGNVTMGNPEADRLLGVPETAPTAPPVEEWGEGAIYLHADKNTPYSLEELPHTRALRGESVRTAELFFRNGNVPDGVWLEVHAAPLRDDSGKQTGAVSVFIDSEARKNFEEEVALRNKELVASESEKSELIARLRMAVQELSTPILTLWEDVLALPVIGVVDSRRSAEMMERLLDEIVRSQSRFVIIDLTGVEVIDTSTADHFMKLVKAVGLIGARCVLTGIRPAVAQTLVDLDVNFGQLETLRNLKHGLRYCLRWLDAEDTGQNAVSEGEARRARWS
ncbi:STAS domain-containing protein [Polyangium jinanense]|uniref:STAS domain-containing protein n=1 Tax=Polyangium jinanense TaxID=2829994 RepID=UPI0023412187|nr:STAS domain-containing protein [Polyangium jinanense]MDC3955612.1 STAS domain-containing protein [Polyangium jinanense]